MKRFLAALLMVPSIALANSFSMKNQNGGEIVITDRVCTYKGTSYEHLRHAYSYWNGGYIEGCWTVTDNMVRIIWLLDHGEPEKNQRYYNFSDFSRKSGGKAY